MILCCVRFLSFCGVQKSVALNLHIIKKMLIRDVAPFMLFVVLTVMAFEVSTYFFSWVTGQPFLPGSFYHMFAGLGTFDWMQWSPADGRLRRGSSFILPLPFSFILRIPIRGTDSSNE
jgi:hypothetical protein